MRALGLDIGERRIGVAMSDPGGIIASPLDVIIRQSDAQAVGVIARLVADNDVGQVVVGMPYSLDGRIGPAAERVRIFVEALRQAISVPVAVWDERMSTVAADRSMRDTGVKRKKQKELRDAIAAALVLQAYLERQRSTGP